MQFPLVRYNYTYEIFIIRIDILEELLKYIEKYNKSLSMNPEGFHIKYLEYEMLHC
jgi:hypothetical protein